MTIGPITILWTREVRALKLVHRIAILLHQRVWFAQDPQRAWPKIMEVDAILSEALSHLPDPL